MRHSRHCNLLTPRSSKGFQGPPSTYQGPGPAARGWVDSMVNMRLVSWAFFSAPRGECLQMLGWGWGWDMLGDTWSIWWYQKGRLFKILKKHQRPPKKKNWRTLQRWGPKGQPDLATVSGRLWKFHLPHEKMQLSGQTSHPSPLSVPNDLNRPELSGWYCTAVVQDGSCAETRGVCWFPAGTFFNLPRQKRTAIQVANVPPSSPRRLLDYSPGSKKLKPPDRSPQGRQQITQQRGPEWSWTASLGQIPSNHHGATWLSFTTSTDGSKWPVRPGSHTRRAPHIALRHSPVSVSLRSARAGPLRLGTELPVAAMGL
jgi:hypothetical protein